MAGCKSKFSFQRINEYKHKRCLDVFSPATSIREYDKVMQSIIELFSVYRS